ncbi:hypothetical protein BG003_002631 [Podila horticola]|nr:hypothetical protein BG003_002631 [Podila horticola]
MLKARTELGSVPANGTYVMIELAYTSKEEYARNFKQYYPNARRTTRRGCSSPHPQQAQERDNLPSLIERIIHCILTENHHDFLGRPGRPSDRGDQPLGRVRLFNSKAALVDEMKTHLRLQDANYKRYLNSHRPQSGGDSA